MNLLVGQLKNAIRDLLEKKGVDASVVDKVNARGEIAIVVVLNERCPACDGTGKRTYARAPVEPEPQKPLEPR